MVDLGSLEAGNVWKHIGMKIIRNLDGQLGVHVKATDKLKQVYGNVHGGIIATAVDAAVAVVVNNVIGQDYGASTVELKVNFLRPVSNSDLFAFAKLLKEGKRLMIGIAEVFDSDDNLIAVGIATYMIKSMDDKVKK